MSGGDGWKPVVVPGSVPSKPQSSEQDAPSVPHHVSRRAHTVWQRMRLWYPNKLAAQPPEDYCQLIDSCSREKVTTVMANMRAKHLAWPPTFPEFALLFTEQQKQEASINWPEILDNFSLKLLSAGAITIEQSRRITWINSGGQPGTAVKFTGLSVPAIGNAPAKTHLIADWAHR